MLISFPDEHQLAKQNLQVEDYKGPNNGEPMHMLGKLEHSTNEKKAVETISIA